MKYALIVAGGIGKRMNQLTPKQFLELEGKPILYYTIKAFLDFSNDINIILVLPKEHIHPPNFISTYFSQQQNIKLVEGGDTRFHSVQNGLNAIDEEGIVFIHDGVRPFVSFEVLEICYNTALQFGNAIPCIDLKESIRHITANGNIAVSRNEYKAIQTPQTFQISHIKKAYHQTYNHGFTDDASVFEAAGNPIHLVGGNEENIKITTPMDLEVAKKMLERQ